MFEAIFEAIFGFFIELAFEAVGEILLELGFNSMFGSLQKSRSNALFLIFIYIIGGGFLAWASTFLFAAPLLQHSAIKIVYFFIGPLLAGLMLCLVNWIIIPKETRRGFFRLDKFIQGIFFALSYSAFRSVFV